MEDEASREAQMPLSKSAGDLVVYVQDVMRYVAQIAGLLRR